jgi:hypothetical protein
MATSDLPTPPAIAFAQHWIPMIDRFIEQLGSVGRDLFSSNLSVQLKESSEEKDRKRRSIKRRERHESMSASCEHSFLFSFIPAHALTLVPGSLFIFLSFPFQRRAQLHESIMINLKLHGVVTEYRNFKLHGVVSLYQLFEV